MLLLMLLAGHRLLKEKNREAGLYKKEHSLFENIRICGPGAGSGRISEKEEKEDPGQASLLPADSRQIICLWPDEEDRWGAYIPSDLSERSYIRFEHFKTLVLKSGETDVPDLSVRSGDRVRWSDFPDGSVLHASAVGWNNKTLEEAEIVLYSADSVPTLYLSTSSGNMDAVNADKSVEEEGRYVFYSKEGKKDVSGRCRIHGRGNSSWKADKKQYSLNLASVRSVLGMEESEKFALIANHSDDSKLKNKAVFDLAAACGMPATPQNTYVNVYFNGIYNGLYLLAQRPNARGGSVRIGDLEEKNYQAALDSGEIEEKTGGTAKDDAEGGGSALAAEKKDSGSRPEPEDLFEKVDHTDRDGLEIHASSQKSVPENISGGYLLEMDGRYEDEKYWFSTDRHHFVVKYPQAAPLQEEEYIADYVRKAEKAFYQKDGVNPETGKSWEEYMDMDSWVKMYVMQDFMAQWDVESFSFFVFKKPDDPLLYCGPVWDFDLSMGATGLGSLPNIMRQSMWLSDHREGWLTQLDSHPSFSKEVKDFSKKEFYPALEKWLEGSDALIDSLETSAAMDCARWGEKNEFRESTHAIRDWLSGRMAFLRDYRDNPQEYCKVTLRYGFSDMDIYIRKGEKIGFVPVNKYGEHLYSSFRKKYGDVDGWTGEDGQRLTEDTVIDHDQVFIPFDE